jgi:hypothetical protein
MHWFLALSLAMPYREVIHATQLARGWATAHMLYKGMPRWAWEPLVADLPIENTSLFGGYETRLYHEHGLWFVIERGGRIYQAEFRPPTKGPPPDYTGRQRRGRSGLEGGRQ